MKNPLTPAGIEPATFRFVAQRLNHCATAYEMYTRAKRVESNSSLENVWKDRVFFCCRDRLEFKLHPVAWTIGSIYRAFVTSVRGCFLKLCTFQHGRHPYLIHFKYKFSLLSTESFLVKKHSNTIDVSLYKMYKIKKLKTKRLII